MFWLPITLSLILIAGQFVFRRAFAISFDIFILFNTLEDELWHTAPTDIRRVIATCSRDLHRLGQLALTSCIALMVIIFTIIASYHADPYQSSIIIIICAIDTYGYFFLFRRLFVKFYAQRQYPRLKAAINYLITFTHQP
ncbi:hypothetical protein D1831_06260 [Lactiplantibacillus garii]|uniref:Uncharacterized protein n=1 Tax=Lactiplantibacillus garii TaxID=2306423 RepID=A0A3R8J899_9LACO|nr:hypothetical protein [Lactiplantibacillus garii]RRK10662.1 hypothetical protein D1831_06260 [Lactiplantibacillus garii]